MELTLKRLLEQAEFTETRKGYDRAEVDELLDRAVAMATKVEAKLTESIDRAKAAASMADSSPAEIEAEVDRRVADRLEVASTGPASASEDQMAEEVRRTIVLAQRTADAAVREAREDAAKLKAEAKEQSAKLLADATERATTLDAEVEAREAAAHAEVKARVDTERAAALESLAVELGELEATREALRSDVTVLERHVEEQRNQLRSSVGELQRLLDDPAGFRLAPTPVLLDPELPDLGARAATTSDPVKADAPAASEPDVEQDSPPAGSPAVTQAAIIIDEPAETSPVSPAPDEVDHAAPGLHFPVESGPPTAPVSAVELGMATPGANRPPRPGRDTGGEEDTFLTELRKAMADDQPLGPRNNPVASTSERDGAFEEDDRRGWRRGKRR